MSTPQVPKWKTMTLLEDQGQIVARLEGAFMPPVGTFVRFPETRRIGQVRSIQLRMANAAAQVVVEIQSGPE